MQAKDIVRLLACFRCGLDSILKLNEILQAARHLHSFELPRQVILGVGVDVRNARYIRRKENVTAIYGEIPALHWQAWPGLARRHEELASRSQ